MNFPVRPLHVSQAGWFAILAWSEFTFGAKVLSLPAAHGLPWLSLALAVPISLDSYVWMAMRRGGKDVGFALGLVVFSSVGGTVAHFVTPATPARVGCSAVFGVIAGIVLWRSADIELHERRQHDLAEDARRAREETTAAQQLAERLAGELDATRSASTAEVEAVKAGAEAERQELRRQLAEAQSSGSSVVPFRSRAETTKKARSGSSDSEIMRVIRPLVQGKPDIGRPALIKAVREASLSCGTDRLVELRDRVAEELQQKAEGMK